MTRWQPIVFVVPALLLAGCWGTTGDAGGGPTPSPDGDAVGVTAGGPSTASDGGPPAAAIDVVVPTTSGPSEPGDDGAGGADGTPMGDDGDGGGAGPADDPAGEPSTAAGGPDGGSGSPGRTVFEDDFESASWYRGWGRGSSPDNTAIISDGTALRGDSFLRVSVPEGEHYGTSFGYDFGRMAGEEPDEVYFRYAVRFGPTWTTEGGGGGKLPGFGGTHDTAGWGGRPADGTNGWSARGLFWQPESGASRSDGGTRVGFYAYHADMTGTWGSNWYWSGGPLDGGAMRRNRWYRVEMYIRNNTPGVNDGALRAWVDGSVVFEKTDIRFRDVERLHVEKVWFDIYYGGDWVPPADMRVDFDDVSIALGPAG